MSAHKNDLQARVAEQEEVPPIASFKELRIYSWLKQVLDELRLLQPTPIQQTTIKAALMKRDVIGAAPTGSGKTLCFALPIIQSLAQEPQAFHSLILTPTRELAHQIADQFEVLGKRMKIRVQLVVGGVDISRQSIALSQRPHIIVATPGRLAHLLKGNTIQGLTLRRTAFLVLDEADRMLSPDFRESFSTIFQQLPPRRQTLLFSATMSPELEGLSGIPLRNPYYFDASPGDAYALPETLKQHYFLIPSTVKDCYLMWLLQQYEEVRSIILFVSSRREAATLDVMLVELGFKSTPLHSLMTQDKRNESIQLFKSGVCQILVATDVASRGLDIPTVSLVINYNVPRVSEDYVHRVGRTARAGKSGVAVTLMTQYDVDYLLQIEEDTSSKLTEYEHKETEVLKLMNKAITAKQVAILHLTDSGFYDKVERFLATKRRQEGKPLKKGKKHDRKRKRPNSTSEETSKRKKRRKKAIDD